jgi:DNA-binding MarR family transcriptional regulator
MNARSTSRRGKATRRSDDRRSPHALDLDDYIPAYLTYLAGKISSGASAVYRPKFGIGITDWRIIALLAGEPWIGASRICNATGLDKAAVSRGVRDLAGAGLIDVRPDRSDQRRQIIALTHKGIALHDRIVELAIAREQALLTGFSDRERNALLAFLVRLEKTVRRTASG